MSRIVKLSEAYRDCGELVARVLATFDTQGEVVHQGRNTIKTFHTPRGRWNVKRYHRPMLFNRVVYRWFKQPKGLRAFLYPRRVLAAGFETPAPVAYVEERSGGLLTYSYFLSEHCPYTRRFYEFGDADINDCRDVVAAFARFTAGLHEAGIYHRDYSPGNILFDRVDGAWRFSIVDINRMEFGPVSLEKGCANFARLWGQPAWFRYLAAQYAEARGADPEHCTELILQARRRFWKPRQKNWHLEYTLRLD